MTLSSWPSGACLAALMLLLGARPVLAQAPAPTVPSENQPASPANDPPPSAASRTSTIPQPSADLPLETVSTSGDWARLGESAGVQASAPRNPSRFRGSLAYNLGDSRLDARPYSLSGSPVEKPEYMRQGMSASIGGPLVGRTFLSLSFNGNRSDNPFTAFARVPDEAQRTGDFSEARDTAGRLVTIFDPRTGQPFSGNHIPADRISPAAAALLGYVPLPNQPGVQNFYRPATSRNESNGANGSLSHLVLAGNAREGGPTSVSSIGISGGYNRSDSRLTPLFPGLGGDSFSRTASAGASYSYNRGRFSNSLTASFNRSRSSVTNQFTATRDIEAELGIRGVSTDPFDWGLPSLSFVNFSGLHDTNASARTSTTGSLAESLRWSRGTHSVRLGGDLRFLRLDQRAAGNARGTFSFTGFATAATAAGQPVPGTGYDLADFLLGLPQRTAVQFTAGDTRFLQTAWSLFVQDDWRVAGRFTLNFGVRYEYAPPYIETSGRLANLDAAEDFSAVSPVTSGGEGPFSGRFPRELIERDRNNVSPRLGAAWALSHRTVLRAGYSLNYDAPPYANFAQRMAQQPPFAVAQTGVTTSGTTLTLADGFPALAPAEVTNTYGVDRHFQAGTAHVGMVELAQITPTLTITATVTKTNGEHLRMLRAPSRIAAGVRTPGAQPFQWESSQGRSDLRAGRLAVRKYFRGGSTAEGSYTYTRSRDNDPSLGGGDVPQDDRNLDAEWARSSFEQRHRAAATYTLAAPAGRNRRWLHDGGVRAAILGNWIWSGELEAASGRPFTPRVLGDYTDVARSPYGSLRADPTGEPVALADPTVDHFFNTDAFAAPVPGHFGTAPRNTITGPGYMQLNMAIVKAFPTDTGRGVELRVQASNVFSTPQFTGLDTYVDSPTYGRITSAGAMRRVLVSLRVNF